jgi:hypothetical protein
MGYSSEQVGGEHAGRGLIEELLRTAFMIEVALASLFEDLPEGAFPGEDNAAVLLEMVVGSCGPVVRAAGESDCRAAVALMGAIRDKVLDDLQAAAELARAGQ